MFNNTDCIFCNKKGCKIIGPVIIGKNCVISDNAYISNFFDLNNEELHNLNQILKDQEKELLNLDKSITGFNIGVNVGKDAGQSIMHCHIHLIPRRNGDVEDPRGGVRGVIPTKQKYERT